MGIAVIVLAIMFLMGFNVGTALAICSIILGACLSIKQISDAITKKVENGEL